MTKDKEKMWAVLKGNTVKVHVYRPIDSMPLSGISVAIFKTGGQKLKTLCNALTDEFGNISFAHTEITTCSILVRIRKGSYKPYSTNIQLKPHTNTEIRVSMLDDFV